MNKFTYDVLFIADHFVMVTTIETIERFDKRDIERDAWARLGEEYGVDWTAMTRPLINNVSIEQVPGTSADEFNEPMLDDIIKSNEETEGE